jgi:glycine cleavage system H protein
MSIGLAVITLLLMVAVFYFRRHQARQAATLWRADPPSPQPQATSEFDPPRGYCFHLGHMWVAAQGREMAKVGIDSFAANLIGSLQKIVVLGEQRWVRQGQKLMTLSDGGETLEMLSPLEGVVTAINPEVIKDPELALRDPYGSGWVCAIKSPEIEINLRNLVQGTLAASWMQNSVGRLKSMVAQMDPSLAQDGGMPGKGLLGKLSPQMRKRVVNEFFLT